MTNDALVPLDREIWVAGRPLRLLIGDIGTRMTVIRIGGRDLLLHSPVPLDSATRAALDGLGAVRWVIGPSRVHHLYLGEYAEAYPEARLFGAPGLAARRRDLAFAGTIEDAEPEWNGEVVTHGFGGAERLSEVVFFHPSSRTLVLTDLAFNVRADSSGRARFFHWLVGAKGRFGPHRIVRGAIRDKAAARRSVDAILAWDFDRVVVTHGQVLDSGGREAMRAAFAYLG